MQADPAEAARTLADESHVDHYAATSEPEPDDWSDGSGWVASGAVVLAPARDRVALVRNWWSDDRWLVPSGSVEPSDDSLRAAARREVREETGLVVSIEEALSVERHTLVHPEDPERTADGWFVLFEATADGTAFGDDLGETETEIEAVRWVDADEVDGVRWYDDGPDGLFNYGTYVKAALDGQ